MKPTQLEVFTECRPVLLALAKRILGRESEAEDLVQETYLRWQKTDPNVVKAPKAFLTTTLTRLCLNHLDLARVRLERDEDTIALDQLHAATPGPDQHAELADALTEAFTKLLTNLSATERAVFLLREAFDFDYADIAPIVERSEENCRQILKRARERLLRDQARHAPPSEQERRVVQVFQEAVTTGELERLLNVLVEEAVLVRDGGNLSRLAPPPLAGAALLAELFRQHQLLEAIPTRLVVGQVLGEHLLLAQRNGATTGAILFQLQRDQIRRIRIVSCPALLRQLQLLSAYSFPAGTQPTEDQQETLS